MLRRQKVVAKPACSGDFTIFECNIGKSEHISYISLCAWFFYEFYRQYAKEISKLPLIEVDTTHMSLEETAQEILRRIEKYEQGYN